MEPSFRSGDVVTDGKRTGFITDGFYWKDADDGTQNEPGHDIYPIAWDDGTQGYRPANQLEYA